MTGRGGKLGALAGPLLLSLLLLFGVTLLTGRELWLDEAHSVYVGRLPLGSLWNAVRGDVHPPLYFLALAGWMRVAGDSIELLRVFSLLFMLAAAVVTWRTAGQNDGESAAIVALALFAASPAILVYAVEIRMYSLAVLGYALFLYSARRTLAQGPSQRIFALATGMAGAFTVLVHYAALFAVGGFLAAWVSIAVLRRRGRETALVACVVFGVALAPWAPTVLQQRERKHAQSLASAMARTDTTALSYGAERPVQPAFPSTLRIAAENAASVIGVFPARTPVLLVILALPFAVLGLIIARRAMTGDDWTLMLLAGAAGNIAGVLLLGLEARRYVLFLAPISALAVAHAVAGHRPGSPQRWAVVTAGAAILLAFAGSLRVLRGPQQTPVTELVALLHAEAGPADRLLFHAPYAQIPFEYHAERAGLRLPATGFPESTVSWWARQPFQGWGSSVPTTADLERTVDSLRAWSTGGTVWLILFESDHYDPRNRVRHRVEREAAVQRRWASADSVWQALRVRYDDAVAREGRDR